MHFETAYMDFGNSRLKVMFGSKVIAFEYGNSERIKHFIEANHISKVIYSSVNACHSDGVLADARLRARNIEEILDDYTEIDFSGVEGMGADRKLGLIAVRSFQAPPFITVDCGTAVTVNIVSGEGKCLGGAIFAGVYSQIRALTQNTAKLFPISFAPPPLPFGAATAAALNAGILYSVAGGIQMLTDSTAEKEFGGIKPKIFITGGYADLIGDLLKEKNNIETVPNLVLSGIKILGDMV